MQLFITNKRIKFSESDIDKVRNAAMQFVVKDIRPFYAVEGEGLRCLCKTMILLGRKYPQMSDADIESLIPHRTVIRERVDDKAEEIQQTIKANFRKALKYPDGFSCTTDLWTDDFKQISYMCLTAHINILEDEVIRHKKYIFHLDSIDALSKTGPVIFEEIKAVFKKFGVSENEIVSKIYWTTDRGGNVKAALSRCKRFNCHAHMMNNIVQHMCDAKDSKQIIKDASALVKFTKSSGINSKLKNSLKSYTETRWNTVHDCIDSIHENYSDVLELLLQKERISTTNTQYVHRLTCLPKWKLKDISEFLSPFKKLTNDIEGENYTTVHRIWPAFLKIQKMLTFSEMDSTVIHDMKRAGRAYFSEIADDFSPAMEHRIGVFLHPLLKGLRIASNAEKEEIYCIVKSLFDDHDGEMSNDDRTEIASPLTQNEMHDDFFGEFLVECQEQNEDTSSDEVQRYINFKLEKVNFVFIFPYKFNSN